MRWLRQQWARFRRWRRIRRARANEAPLREFVYLDDVSVYSLLTSRQGALASEYTDIATTSRRAEISSSFGVSGDGPNASLGSKLGSGQSRSSQVVRKSTIQAAFKEFYEGEEGRLVFRPVDGSPSAAVRSWLDLDRMIGTPLFEGWIVDPTVLVRGGLAVLDVELRADPVFRATSIIATLRNIVAENPKMFVSLIPSLDEVAAINRILDQFLAGLIPIHCRIRDFDAVLSEGRRVLVHRTILDGLPLDETRKREAVHLVGVTEERLFWKDVRRVLFASSRFQVMCRLNYEGIRDTWVPVKLTNVLDEVIPGLGSQFSQFGHSVFSVDAANSTYSDSTERLRSALMAYGSALAAQSDSSDAANAAAIDEALLIAGENTGDVHSLRRAFNAVSDVVLQPLEDRPNATTLAQLRAAALEEFGLFPDGTLNASAPIASTPVTQANSGPVLDGEVVAVYW